MQNELLSSKSKTFSYYKVVRDSNIIAKNDRIEAWIFLGQNGYEGIWCLGLPLLLRWWQSC